MFELNKVKVLHLEPTTKCNARCPQCLRTDIRNTTLPNKDLSLDQVKTMFSESFVRQLDKMFMCGNLGDPAAARDTIEIFKWFRSVNPEITLGLNTNGGVRSTRWWAELSSILTNPLDFVIFSIDGLKDTNHIYRVGVKWDKLIANITAFTEHSGSATWEMLIYEHNQHQIQEAIALAKQLRFSWFRTKITRRNITVPFLQLPSNTVIPIKITTNDIKCQALKEQSIYVNANGAVFPCCWLGARDPTLQLTNEFADISTVFNDVIATWGTNNTHPTCKGVCSVTADDSGTTFLNQWQNNYNLHNV